MGLKSNPLDLSSCRALTLLVGSLDPYKPVTDMTYNVFGGTLNFAQSGTAGGGWKRQHKTDLDGDKSLWTAIHYNGSHKA